MESGTEIRLLILDDAMISGRTAETVLAHLMRVISEVTEDGKFPSPVEWIRYFSILNLSTYAHNVILRSMTTLGANLGVKILFEDFAPFMGVPTYDADSCPHCKRYNRLKVLHGVCGAFHAHDATHWIDKTLAESYPIAVDGLDLHRTRGAPSRRNFMSSRPLAGPRLFTLRDSRIRRSGSFTS